MLSLYAARAAIVAAAVSLVTLIMWMAYENRQLIGHVGRIRGRDGGPPPQPGGVGGEV